MRQLYLPIFKQVVAYVLATLAHIHDTMTRHGTIFLAGDIEIEQENSYHFLDVEIPFPFLLPRYNVAIVRHNVALLRHATRHIIQYPAVNERLPLVLHLYNHILAVAKFAFEVEYYTMFLSGIGIRLVVEIRDVFYLQVHSRVLEKCVQKPFHNNLIPETLLKAEIRQRTYVIDVFLVHTMNVLAKE
jgi:hypothetical protein